MKSDKKTVAAAVYLMQNAPFSYSFSKGRLAKLLYIADVRAEMENRKPITCAQWMLRDSEPEAPALIPMLVDNPAIQEVDGQNIFGNESRFLTLTPGFSFENSDALDSDERRILDGVLADTSGISWMQFIKKVHAAQFRQSQRRQERLELN